MKLRHSVIRSAAGVVFVSLLVVAVGGSPSPGQTAVQAAPAPAANRFHTVHLLVDGNLAGRTSVADGTGKNVPAKVRIGFVQNGAVVQSARSSEGGVFQVPKLKPGLYSVIAVGRDGVAVFSVNVRPYDAARTPRPFASAPGKVAAQTVAADDAIVQDPPSDESFLDIPLIPRSDLEPLEALAGEEVPGAAVPGAASASPGGGAGGGGGAALGAFGGMAGLAGLAGLAGRQPASPASP